MSASAAAAAATGGGASPPDDDADIETRARAMGWKPKEEFHGRGEWRPAAEFLERAEADGRIYRERYGALERRFVNLERTNADLSRKHDEALTVISDLSDRFRTTDERAYKRARRELEAERDEAIRTGDVQSVRAKDAELAELDASKPAPPKPPGSTPKETTPAAPPPEAVAWAARNPWYNMNPQLHQMVLGVHQRLLQDQPELSISENLDRVTRTMHAMYPDLVPAPGAARRAAAPDPEPEPEPEPENPRRSAAPEVLPSSASRGGARQNPRSYDAMPADSKAAYVRYSKQLEGKGKPLTKDEWAASYWAQFD